MRTAFLLAGTLVVPSFGWAQEATGAPAAPKAADPLAMEAYLKPPREIAEAVLAPRWKNFTPSGFSPEGNHFLVQERPGLPKLADLGRPHANLAGLDVDTVANRARTLSVRGTSGILMVPLTGGDPVRVPLAADVRASDPTWSPDGKHLAYLAHFPNRSEVWVYSVADRKNRRLGTDSVLATLVTGVSWLDADTVLAVTIPKVRPQIRADVNIANTPRVGVTEGRRISLRTYASLLGGPDDATRFEYFTTGQITLFDLDGKSTAVGKPMMVSQVGASPDGRYLRVTTVERPFTYLQPYSSFGQREVVMDLSGDVKVELRKRGVSSGDGPAGGAPEARRNLEWRPDGKGFSYIRSDAGGNDRVVLWKPPFTDKDIEEIYSAGGRIASVRYNADASLLFITSGVAAAAAPGGRGARPTTPPTGRPGGNAQAADRTRTYVVKPGGTPVTLFESRSNDDPASLVTMTLPNGASAVRVTKSGDAFIQGVDYAEDPFKTGPKPWLDRISLGEAKRARIWESAGDQYETVSILDSELNSVIVTRQSPTQIANSYLVNLNTKAERKLTDNRDYLPDLTQARKERIQVTRNDGIKFWITVTYPRYYTYGKLPAFFWFYPREYTDQAAYNQTFRTFNKNTFSDMSPSNKAILIRRGYLLVEPDCPIIGPTERKNDAYIPQLRNNLAATIDELDRRGVIDRTRLALGGHSYGAFSTVNAMVHTPFFKAGIAGDGNYNRLLTPFGFQSDQRLLWEARETYLSMSPILYAEQMTGALLMYHGMEDQNVGTDPINSERLFATLQALGKPAALYMYPYEDHGQIAEETILDQWARWVAWLDKHLAK